jgi:hypothetical protein
MLKTQIEQTEKLLKKKSNPSWTTNSAKKQLEFSTSGRTNKEIIDHQLIPWEKNQRSQESAPHALP